MRRIATALGGFACVGVALATPASAYEIDPLTRQPLNDVLTVRVRAQNASQPADVPTAELDATVPRVSAIPREMVAYSGPQAPGTVVVSTAERRLYLVMPGGQAMRYGVGVGRPGFTWGGTQSITMKKEWPEWRPPSQMLRRRPDLPRYMKGGIQNPLGARAMYLGSSIFRIHGSNEPESIGQAVSSGCIRMTNDDVVDLYGRVKVGTRVIVQR